MGYYVKGTVLQLQEMKDILSEATQFGTIQVPPSGHPIILMADAQTVGVILLLRRYMKTIYIK